MLYSHPGIQVINKIKMKLTKIFAAAALVLMTASCGVLGSGSTQATSAGTTGGQASGAALKNLYTQFQADGKLDVTNISNVVNLATLANGIQGLKNQDDKSAFYADFAKGLVLGSGNLISNTTAPSITNTLSGLANTDLSALTNAASAALSSGLAGTQNTTQTTQGAGLSQLAGLLQGGSQTSSSSSSNTASNTGSEISETIQNATSAISSLTSDSNVSSAVSTVSSILGLLGK